MLLHHFLVPEGIQNHNVTDGYWLGSCVFLYGSSHFNISHASYVLYRFVSGQDKSADALKDAFQLQPQMSMAVFRTWLPKPPSEYPPGVDLAQLVDVRAYHLFLVLTEIGLEHNSQPSNSALVRL